MCAGINCHISRRNDRLNISRRNDRQMDFLGAVVFTVANAKFWGICLVNISVVMVSDSNTCSRTHLVAQTAVILKYMHFILSVFVLECFVYKCSVLELSFLSLFCRSTTSLRESLIVEGRLVRRSPTQIGLPSSSLWPCFSHPCHHLALACFPVCYWAKEFPCHWNLLQARCYLQIDKFFVFRLPKARWPEKSKDPATDSSGN